MALVLEDGVDLSLKLRGTQGHSHLNLVGLELLPCAAIEPDFAPLEPGLSLDPVDCQQNCLQEASSRHLARLQADYTKLEALLRRPLSYVLECKGSKRCSWRVHESEP